jgi:hypothetical protein
MKLNKEIIIQEVFFFGCRRLNFILQIYEINFIATFSHLAVFLMLYLALIRRKVQ